MSGGYFVASVSWGKDSTAMLHLLLDRGDPLDEVVFYDTGAEFDAVYAERDRMVPLLAERGVRYMELRPKRPFFFDIFAKTVRHRDGTESQGYGWCGGACRWGTRAKADAVDRYVRKRGGQTYIGIAADEPERAARSPGKLMPLVEAGMPEADRLELCYSRGHTWEQDGVRLYDVLDRVSCWCCRNKNLKELEAMREHLPRYYEMLVAIERALGEPMKRRPLEGGTDA